MSSLPFPSPLPRLGINSRCGMLSVSGRLLREVQDPLRTTMSNAQAITEVWEYFDADGKGYIESEGLAEALAARLTAVDPDSLQARVLRDIAAVYRTS